MKSTLYEKVKYVVERLLFHGKKFVEDTGEVFKSRIDTAAEASELLRTTASIKDLYAIKDAVVGSRFNNGKINTYMSSDEYTLYDDYGYKLYYFNGEKADFINDEELLKVSKIIGAVNKIKNKARPVNYVYAIRTNGKYQYFFQLDEGKNGSGDFVDDDMKNVIKCLDAMKEAGADWRCVTDVVIDIPDDVSAWVITFTTE